jgi:hypothetical protein
LLRLAGEATIVRSWQACLAVLTLACAGAGEARAQADILSRETFHGLVEVRVAAADGERSWLDGGFGKTGVSGGRDDWRADAELTLAAIEWRPRFNFAISGVVTALVQPDLSPKVDLGEAYLNLKAPPTPAGRFSGRIGVFYPPVSMEHDGVAWTTPDMLSGSMLNSWIGEEVKVMGVEATFQRSLGAHDVEATAAVFGWNDTSGTLLTFRGWATHGVRTGISTEFELPPLSPFAAMFQPPDTYPFRELDNRAGYYGRLAWRPPAPVSFNALYYDNAGNRTAVDADGQWAWETRFLNVGIKWEPSETTKVLAQAMNGETLMGYRKPGGLWFDMGFRAAYVLATHKLGDDAVSGRIDWFRTTDRSFQAIDDNAEDGWALTAAWRHRLAPHADILFEAQHVNSKRPARLLAGDAPKQDQTVLQTALRLSF